VRIEMIRALFFDFDGTLLDSKNKIPPKTLEALKICRKKGIYIFPTTGRPPLLKEMLQF
jgi:hydroxymethylpyrimidine pyrophosphatase-like HAD family hydrolase